METRGVRVRFSPPAHENRYWWTILECDERFMVCVRGHVASRRSGVKGACRPADVDWLLAQARTQRLIDTRPLYVAVFAPEVLGSSGTYGHVAAVEEVGGDGSITISEANVGGKVGPFRRTISGTDAGLLEYIHY